MVAAACAFASTVDWCFETKSQRTPPRPLPTFFDCIISTLIFEKAAKGDTTGALDRLGRCVEVFERYPGLHRFAMG